MKLIINADDFGLSKSITDGIIDGIKFGCITSTSIMVNMPYAKYAVENAVKNNINCVGLHINLTVGKPVLTNNNLTDDNGVFLYNRKQIDRQDINYSDVYEEIVAQINLFEKYSGGKIKLDHLDTHHHLIDNPVISQAIFDIAKKYNLPVRNWGGVPNYLKTPDVFMFGFTIKNVDYNYLKTYIMENKSKNIYAELATHAGYVDEETKSITSYLNRDAELEILKQAKQDGLFDDVELISFSQLLK